MGCGQGNPSKLTLSSRQCKAVDNRVTDSNLDRLGFVERLDGLVDFKHKGRVLLGIAERERALLLGPLPLDTGIPRDLRVVPAVAEHDEQRVGGKLHVEGRHADRSVPGVLATKWHPLPRLDRVQSDFDLRRPHIRQLGHEHRSRVLDRRSRFPLRGRRARLMIITPQ